MTKLGLTCCAAGAFCNVLQPSSQWHNSLLPENPFGCPIVLPRLGLAQLGSAPHGSTKYGIQKPSRAIEDWLASHGSGSAPAQPWLKSVLGNNIYKRSSEMSETLRLSIKAIISTGIKASSVFNTSSSFNSSKRLVPAVKVKL